jgi:hypothetical protein
MSSIPTEIKKKDNQLLALILIALKLAFVFVLSFFFVIALFGAIIVLIITTISLFNKTDKKYKS